MLRGGFVRRAFRAGRSAKSARHSTAVRAVPIAASVRRTVPGTTQRFTSRFASSSASARSGMSSVSLAAGAFGTGIAGYGAYAYLQQIEKERLEIQLVEELAAEERRKEEIALRPSDDDYQHPYDALPWYKRIFKTVGRILYLSYLFVPCTALGLVTSFSTDKSWRKFFIDYLVRTMEAAGSTFQKYGQWISNRPDIFPPDVISAMKGLCNEAPVHSAEETRQELRRSFGCEVEDLFDEFDFEPIASGTIAQVHRAKLKPEHALKNGRVDVAVKVRHPGVMDETYVDAEILFGLVSVSSKFNRAFCVPFQQEEFTNMIQKQINLKWEAYNIWRFRNNFRASCAAQSAAKATANEGSAASDGDAATGSLQQASIGNNQVQFPRVSHSHVSTSVLIEEWVQGTSVQDFFEEVGEGFQRTAKVAVDAATQAAEKVAAAPRAAVEKAAQMTSETKHRIASAVLHTAFHMFFRDNLVHGDLHGGNVLFDEKRGEVTLIDAGITTALGSKQTTDDFLCFLHGMSVGDAEILTDTLLRLSTENSAADGAEDADLDLDAFPRRLQFKQEVQESCERWIDMDELHRTGKATARTGGPVPVGDLMGDLMQCMSRNGVRLRGDVATTVVTIAMCEGLVRQLDPHIDMLVESVPYIRKYCDYETLSKFV